VRIQRLAVAGLGLVAALTFSGCADKGGSPAWEAGNASVDATATADPKATLTAAAAKLEDTSFKIAVDMGTNGKLDGQMDGPNKRGHMITKITAEGVNATIENLVIGTDMYMKMNMPGAGLPGMDGSKWMHLDMAKLPENNAMGLRPGQFDPFSTAKFIDAVATAERVEGHRFTGTLDLTKVSGAVGIEAKDLTGLGEKAKAVPFVATTDSEDRLINLVIDMPALGEEPAQKMTTTYSDFGLKVDAAKPAAAEVTEAPDAIYGTLGA
jgi:hypothetical protein